MTTRIEKTFVQDIHDVLTQHEVNSQSLEDYLKKTSPGTCDSATIEDLRAGLEKLRRIHVDFVENHEATGVWGIWENELDHLSDSSQSLVMSWLDSPTLASAQYFCIGNVELFSISHAPQEFSAHLVLVFKEAILEKNLSSHEGRHNVDREQSVFELKTMYEELLHAYKDQYGYDDFYGSLEEQLESLWYELVDPYDTGFYPRITVDDPQEVFEEPPHADPVVSSETIAQELAKQDYYLSEKKPRTDAVNQVISTIFNPSIPIPNLEDIPLLIKAAIEAMVANAFWDRQIHSLGQKYDELEKEAEEVKVAMQNTQVPGELVHLRSKALRIDARLAHLSEDSFEMQERIRRSFATLAANLPVNPVPPDNHLVPKNRRLENIADRANLISGDINTVLDQIDETKLVLADHTYDLAPTHSGSATHDNIITGDAETTTTPIAQTNRLDPTQLEWITKTYVGPIPLPSSSWSPDLIQTMQDKFTELDTTDIRILLELIGKTYTELPDRESIEQIVWHNLEQDHLRLRGQESILSDLIDQAKPGDQQVEIKFVLSLKL